MPKAAIYCRVSTDEQTTKNQKLQLIKLANSRGYELTTIYYENETAWKRGHQAELERCKQAAFNGDYNVLLIWSLDRLTRLGVSSMFKICEFFWNLNITIVSMQEPQVEHADMFREAIIFFSGLFAKIDSDRKSERTKAGIARRKLEKPIQPRGPDKHKRARRSDIGEKHRRVKE
jgi:putative DNA-invertase from lambdoid prophage Rac